VALLLAIIATGVALPQAALAHERRAVGKYTFVVGFAVEPAFNSQPNGMSLRITDTANNEPVAGAEKTLKAAVAFGGNAPKEFPLRAVFGQAGLYQADFIPTRSGAYIFTFTGDINGQAVNEKFESGPGRFNDVVSSAELQFPDVVQAPAELQRALNDANARANAAAAAAAQAQMFAYGGIGLGLIGLLAGGAALMSSRRREDEPKSQPARVR
jgi:hypothetical protein